MSEVSKKEINKIFGGIFKKYRLKNKYTQEVIAEKLGISSKYISRIENGIQGVSDETLIKYINILEIIPNELYSDFVTNDNIKKKLEISEKINNLSNENLNFLNEIIDLLVRKR